MSKKFTTKEARIWSEAMVSALTERLGEPTSIYTPKYDEKARSYEWVDVTLPNGDLEFMIEHKMSQDIHERWEN